MNNTVRKDDLSPETPEASLEAALSCLMKMAEDQGTREMFFRELKLVKLLTYLMG